MRKKLGLKMLVMLTAMMTLSGCAKRYESVTEAKQDGARMAARIEIDGADVSGMTVDEAMTAVMAAQRARAKALDYTVSAGGDSVKINGVSLPLAFDTERALLQALNLGKNYPANNPVRELSTVMTCDKEKLRAALSSLTAPLDIAPEDAFAAYDPMAEGRFVFTEQVNGRSVDVSELAQRLHTHIIAEESADIDAKMKSLPAAYTVDMARADNQLIAEFTTSFSGSTYGKANRVHNIVKAAGLMDGVRVEAGEEFDMNAVLGDRNAQNGWKTAAGIRDGTYVQEYGGGVCQVSTTLYNAVLMSDLTVTDRQHHSWPLGYVDIGRDATISTGGPNFKFKNESGTAVTISAFADTAAKTVTVRIYGRALKDGVRITLTSKKTETLADPGNEIRYDSALAAGESYTERKARRGAVAKTYKHYYSADGELLGTELVTTDKYRSIKGIVYVSRDSAAVSAEPTGMTPTPTDAVPAA